MTPRTWFRAGAGRRSAEVRPDPRPADPHDVPNFWAFLIHVTGEPVSWSGIAKLITLTMTLVLSLVLVIGAAGWALHEAPLAGRADRLTVAGGVAGILGALFAALKTHFLRRQVLRGLTVRAPIVADGEAAPRLQLVSRDIA